nr:MAG TPA: hypothetical protein [Caudoviricetes sp.]
MYLSNFNIVLAKTIYLAKIYGRVENWQKSMARPSASFSHNKQGNM